jgi:hypothetical protein
MSRMTQPQDPVADSVAAWKKMTDEYLAALGKSLEEAKASGATEAATQQAERSYLEMQNLMRTTAQQAYAPMVEAFGAVPLTEFQRLQDQVHTILLRLDRIDDALREIRDGMGGVAAKGKKAKKKG